MKPIFLVVLLLILPAVEVHSLPVLSTVWELLGGENTQIKVNLTLTGTIEKVNKVFELEAREPNGKPENDGTTQTSQPGAGQRRRVHQETTPDTVRDISSYQTAPSETSGTETTQQATTPYGEPKESTTTSYEKTTEQAILPYSEPTETTTSPYGRKYDDSSDSSEMINEHERRASTIETTTTQPAKHECPITFKFIDGSCFQVVPGLVTGYKSDGRCKQYAHENNLPEEDVGLGMILNDEQNTAVHNLALEKELVRELKKQLGYGEMMVGVWRPAGGMFDVWKYMRNNQSVIYTNFHSAMHLVSNFDDKCVSQFLDPYAPYLSGGDVGKWDDDECDLKLVAVLCEYKDPSYFRNQWI